ncbi:MAG: fibronectin type III domain-containing protein [Planctomycetes bacterium]|nr:fibronectin type III domain-containing protein [Planctomycetota bacterium]
MAHAARLASGEVAVFGGHSDAFETVDTVEVLDPAAPADGWTSITMQHGHDIPYFARLADGKFLIAGGALPGAVPAYADAEIFDPVARTFTETDACLAPRCGGTAATLTDGRVLLVGAWDDVKGASSTGEFFDPADHTDTPTGTFSITGSLNVSRAYPTVVPTTDGGALVIGGVNPVPGDSYRIRSIETWDATTRVFGYVRDDLFAAESGWEPTPGYDNYRPVEEQRIYDGRYLFSALKPGGGPTAQTLYTVDGATGAVERYTTTPDLPTTADAELITTLVDTTGETARLLLRDATGTAPFERFQFATLTLRTGVLARPTGWFVPPGDHAPVSGGQTMTTGGRIVLAGGPDLSNPDGSHNSGMALVVTDPTPPVLPPQPPQAVTAVVSGPTQVAVRWTDASDRETGWHVERRTAGLTTWLPMGDAPADATSLLISPVPRGQPFNFRVASFNTAGASVWIETTPPVTIEGGKASAPKRLDFGAVKAEVAKVKKLWITNTDKRVPLTVGVTSVTGPFSVGLASGIVIAPRKRASIDVTVLAPSKGSQAGLLTLWTTDVNKPACVLKLAAKAKPAPK